MTPDPQEQVEKEEEADDMGLSYTEEESKIIQVEVSNVETEDAFEQTKKLTNYVAKISKIVPKFLTHEPQVSTPLRRSPKKRLS